MRVAVEKEGGGVTKHLIVSYNRDPFNNNSAGTTPNLIRNLVPQMLSHQDINDKPKIIS